MRLRLKPNLSNFSYYRKHHLVYRPDFITYDLESTEYKEFWQEIRSYSEKQKPLYTNGIQVYKVGKIRAWYESFKGWLGFTNHCHPTRISLTLQKIAYAGYLKGLQSDDLTALDTSLVPKLVTTLAQNPKKDDTSEALQSILISFYQEHAEHLPPLPSETYRFGNVLFASRELYTLVSELELQNPAVITDAVNYATNYYNYTPNRTGSGKTAFGKAYAQKLIQNELQNAHYRPGKRPFPQVYDEALFWDSEIQSRFLLPYFNLYCYLTENKIDPDALIKNVRIIQAAFTLPVIESQQKIVQSLKQLLSKEQQICSLTAYPDLKRALAKIYYQDALNEEKKYTLTKMIQGTQTLNILRHATILDPHILSSKASCDLKLQTIWAHHLYQQAIIKCDYQPAEQLHLEYPHIKFPDDQVKKLQEHYRRQFDILEFSIKGSMVDKESTQAQEESEKRMLLAKKITIPANGRSVYYYVKTSIIDHAALLLKIDEQENPNAKNANLDLLDKAGVLLREFHLLNQDTRASQVMNSILLRKIDFFIDKMGLPFGGENWGVRHEFVTQHQWELTALRQNLDLFIILNEKAVKNEPMRAPVARAHFLLAESLNYLGSSKLGAIPHYEKAAKLMPNNPFYQYFYAHVTNDDSKMTKASNQIKAMGDLCDYQFSRYLAAERCYRTPIESEGLDIHAIPPASPGVIARLINGS